MATTDDADTDDFREVVALADLEESGRELVSLEGTPVAVFHHEGEVRAVNNRCPHMGFPLVEGTVDDGILTCHWHHARFELSCGDTFDSWADDLKRTLGPGLLREDAGFHTLQNLEAAFRQFDLASERAAARGDGADEGTEASATETALERRRRVPLIATARYMAAHFPTRREAEQTFTIAARLNRGEAIHDD